MNPLRGMELSAVLSDGKAYAGLRDQSPLGEYSWEEISDEDNFPKNACSITISVSTVGNDAWIKVLTTKGRVYETHGNRDNDEFVWDEEWERLTTPDDDNVSNTTREKGDLAPGSAEVPDTCLVRRARRAAAGRARHPGPLGRPPGNRPSRTTGRPVTPLSRTRGTSRRSPRPA